MRVLGIDPGLAATGYAVVERSGGRLVALAAGTIRTPSSARHGDRLLHLHGSLGDVIAASAPEVVAAERLFFNTNVRSAMAVGQAAGVALLCAAESGLPVAHYTPPQVKLSVVGTGGASKKQVQAMVVALLGLGDAPAPDAADAAALAICHLNRSGLADSVAAALAAAPGRTA